MALTVPTVKGGLGQYGVLCNTITHRSAIAADDAAFPADNTTSIDCRGYRYAVIDLVITGTTPTFDITPGFYDGTNWFRGQARTITENSRFIVEVDSVSALFVLCDGKSGTSPNITVYVTPFNV